MWLKLCVLRTIKEIPQKYLLCSLYVHAFGVPTASFVRTDIYIGRQAFIFGHRAFDCRKLKSLRWRQELEDFGIFCFQPVFIKTWSFGLMFWTEQ